MKPHDVLQWPRGRDVWQCESRLWRGVSDVCAWPATIHSGPFSVVLLLPPRPRGTKESSRRIIYSALWATKSWDFKSTDVGFSSLAKKWITHLDWLFESTVKKQNRESESERVCKLHLICIIRIKWWGQTKKKKKNNEEEKHCHLFYSGFSLTPTKQNENTSSVLPRSRRHKLVVEKKWGVAGIRHENDVVASEVDCTNLISGFIYMKKKKKKLLMNFSLFFFWQFISFLHDRIKWFISFKGICEAKSTAHIYFHTVGLLS